MNNLCSNQCKNTTVRVDFYTKKSRCVLNKKNNALNVKKIHKE